MRRSLGWLWPVASLAVAACAHTPASVQEDPLGKAAERAAAGSGNARVLALAGFHALLATGDVAQARSWLDASLAADAEEPWALHGQAWLATWNARPERTLTLALEQCVKNPDHPLATVAARQVLEAAGQSKDDDGRILTETEKALAAGPSPDVAWLLRAARTVILGNRGGAGLGAAVRELGAPMELSLAGPYSPWHVLSLADALPPENTGSLEAGSPPGGVRTVKFPDGVVWLGAEGGPGDGYVLAADVEVERGGRYVLRVVTPMDHAVLVDGQRVLERQTWLEPASTETSRRLSLSSGKHRLLVRVARGQQSGHLSLHLLPADGAPSTITYRAAKGAPERWAPGVALPAKPDDDLAAAAPTLAAQLEGEAGPVLSRVVAALDGKARDRDGAKRLLSEVPAGFVGAPLTTLKAELALDDRGLPARIGRGRATRDLEAALEKDPKAVPALLAQGLLAFEDARHADALELVSRAKAVSQGAPVRVLEARVALALGLDGRAEQAAREALTARPGDCEALALLADTARRRDATAEEAERVKALEGCPSALERGVDLLRSRGALEVAAERLRAMADVGGDSKLLAHLGLSQVLVSLGQPKEGAKVLEAVLARWPRHVAAWLALADARALAGDPAGSLAARESALALDGGNLSLRRSVERARTGKELLDAHAISTQEAFKAYAAAPGDEDAPAAYLLDAAAVRVYPDGSQVDRVHIIQKALDQNGVSEIAEVSIPQGAQLLSLRTLKADGTSLEPESIEGKETLSLPGVQVGDSVEYEYLLAHPARGPGQPGFTASTFYFQIARQPNNWSTYTVVAPKGSGLVVDPHHVRVQPPRVEGETEVFFHEERRVPPYLPEPGAPPSGNEWLPWVMVGAGTLGNDGVIRAYADAFLDRGRVTAEVRTFALQAAQGRAGLEAVKAVYAAVMQKLSGRDGGLAVPAAASAVQDRGSRLWLLRSALRSLGFDARIAAVHTFNADPEPSKLPNEALLPYLAVRVRVPGNGDVWLDTLVRFAPFGELPELARGRDAWVLPEPGLPLERVRTPTGAGLKGKDVVLTLSLGEDGVLQGSGVETYRGFEAAQLAEALEQLPVEQREQALEGALSRYFGGAQLTTLALELNRAVGADVVVKYAFTAPRFARKDEEGRLVLGALTYPALLGRRYLALSSRSTPLYLEGSEVSRTTVTLTLPQGFKLVAPLAEVKVPSPHGRFVRAEKQAGRVVTVTESLELPQARIAPSAYEAFARFAGEVDLLQGRDVLVAPSGG